MSLEKVFDAYYACTRKIEDKISCRGGGNMQVNINPLAYLESAKRRLNSHIFESCHFHFTQQDVRVARSEWNEIKKRIMFDGAHRDIIEEMILYFEDNEYYRPWWESTEGLIEKFEDKGF